MTRIEIVETQQESEIDDETVFTLFVDGTIMSWAKTTLYGNLEDIRTALLEKHRGYGRLLLAFIEKNARNHSAVSMSTSDFDACNVEATGFFKSMLYTVNPSLSLENPVQALKNFRAEP